MTRPERAAITSSGRATWWKAPWACLPPEIRPRRCARLIYLAARQEEDGGFPQNFWVNGEAFRNGTQLDEIAFPVLLAWRLHKLQLLGGVQSSRDGQAGGRVPAAQRAGHGRRAMGRGRRLFSFHPGRRDRRLHLRRRLLSRVQKRTTRRHRFWKAMPISLARILKNGP